MKKAQSVAQNETLSYLAHVAPTSKRYGYTELAPHVAQESQGDHERIASVFTWRQHWTHTGLGSVRSEAVRTQMVIWPNASPADWYAGPATWMLFQVGSVRI